MLLETYHLSVLGQMQTLRNLHSTPPNPLSAKKQLFQSHLTISEAWTPQKLCEGAGATWWTAVPAPLNVTPLSPYLNPSQ